VTDRLIDISESGAVLSLENGLLSIRPSGQPKQVVPLDEIGALVTSHRDVVFTQSLLAALGKSGVTVICCDERHHPASMLLPLDCHYSQVERFRSQAEAKLPIKKRIWQEIVWAKLEMQGTVLRLLSGDDAGLPQLARRVGSGDPTNLEATAAQRYWPRLFRDAAFRRGNEDDKRNAMLNYGYAVLRAVTARAVCASGLHPSFGVNHRNRYNAFCLADDLMEPARPLIDYRVVDLCRDWRPDQWDLNKTAKLALLAAVAGRYESNGEQRTLFDITARRAQNLAAVLMGEKRSMDCEAIGIA
jgi:CRISPR-associated protein Cas1